MRNNAKDRQTVTYNQSAFLLRGNDMVIELCLTFVYGGLLPSKRKAKQRTLPAHYQSVVLVWLIPAF